jgi:hypothetical protein
MRYDAALNTWQQETASDFVRHCNTYACVTYDRHLLVLGGSIPVQSGACPHVYSLAPPIESFNPVRKCWSAISAPPLLKRSFKAAVCRRNVYVMTGDGAIVRWQLPILTM